MAKKTPLYEEHLALGGNMAEYAGWILPMEYEGLTEEHTAVRERVGIFDVSHMGEIRIQGKDALDYLDYMTSNHIKDLENGKCLYCFLLYEDGGVVDDLIIYKASDEDLTLVVNAANTDKDYDWLVENKEGFDIEITDLTDDIGLIAVQGPKAQACLQKLTDFDLEKIKNFNFEDDIQVAGADTLVSRTGYTGEEGFEIYSSGEDLVKIWRSLLEAGEEFGIQPCGLGARDTLRFEAGLALYGNEISQDISPIEAGLDYFVDLDKDADFIGKDALADQVENGPERKLVGFELKGPGVVRQGYKLFKDGKEIGQVTTGYPSPTLGKTLANVLVDADQAVLGNEVEVQIRKRFVDGEIVNNNFLKEAK